MIGLGVGRVVHYVAFGTPGGEFPAGVCRAAIITEFEDLDNRVSVCVLNPSGLFFNRGVRYDEGIAQGDGRTYTPGTWHWPERT